MEILAYNLVVNCLGPRPQFVGAALDFSARRVRELLPSLQTLRRFKFPN